MKRQQVRLDDLRGQIDQAFSAQDWPAVIDLGSRLHAVDDYGKPAGRYASMMEAAAGTLGRRFEACFFNRLGLEKVDPKTDLEARLLRNGMYSARLYGAPNRALELGSRYLEHYPDYPNDAQNRRCWVLYLMGGAHEDRGDLDQAVSCYAAAIEDALTRENHALAGMVKVDMAYAHLLRGGSSAFQTAQSVFSEVDFNELNERGRFTFFAVLAFLKHAQAAYHDSQEAVRAALQVAESIAETLLRERAVLMLLQARNAHATGDRQQALLLGLQAGRGFEVVNDYRGVAQSEAFLRAVLGLKE